MPWLLAILTLVIGIVILAKHRNKGIWVVLLGADFFLTGALMIAALFFWGTATALLIAVIGWLPVIVYAEIARLQNLFRCREKIPAKFITCNTRTHRGVTSYLPVFEYRYSGETYTGQTIQFFSKRFIKKHYTEGEYCEVYICPENPEQVIVKKRLMMSDILLFLVILMFVFVILAGLGVLPGVELKL